MNVIIWYKHSYDAEWRVYGVYDDDTLEFKYLLSTLLMYPAGRVFRVSYSWDWSD